MSRAEIAAAASTVEGVTVTAEYRQTLRPGHGFVKWNGRTRDDSGLGWLDIWQVWLALAQDVNTAEGWITDHLDTLIAAVDDQIVVTDASPADLMLGGHSTNGLIIEGTRPAA